MHKPASPKDQRIIVTLVNHKEYLKAEGTSSRVNSLLFKLPSSGYRIRFVYWSNPEEKNIIESRHVPDGLGRDPTNSQMNENSSLPEWDSLNSQHADKMYTAIPVLTPKMRLLNSFLRHSPLGAEASLAAQILGYNHPKLLMMSLRAIGSSDVVHCVHIWSSLFPLLLARIIGKKSILDDQNFESALAPAISTSIESRLAKRIWQRYVLLLEKTCCRLATTTTVVSERDKNQLHSVFGVPNTRIRVIPTGINLEKYRPDPTLAESGRKILGVSRNPVVAFVGRYSYPPNKAAVDFITRVLCHEVWRKLPEVRFVIVSRDLPYNLTQSRDSRIVYDRLDNDQMCINAADVCIAPMSVEGGMSVKILTYMACGKPTVCTPNLALRLGAASGVNLITSDLRDFANSIIELLSDKKTCDALGLLAREFVVKNYSEEATVRLFEELYNDLSSA